MRALETIVLERPVSRLVALVGLMAVSACNCGTRQVILPSCGLALTPPWLDAGLVLVGTTAIQDLALSNDGAGDLTLLSAIISEDGGASFAVQSFSPTTLPAGQPLQLQVAFSPEAAGLYDATLTIETDCGTASVVDLGGVGVAAPSASVSPQSLSFDCVPQGTTAAAQIVTVANSGGSGEDVTVGTFPAGSGFSVTTLDPAGAASDGGTLVWLDAGASLAISVSYEAPPDGGAAPEQQTLLIFPCASCAPSQVMFNATTAAILFTATPNFLNFGNVPSGETSDSTAVTVEATTNGCDVPATLIGPPRLLDGGQGFTVAPVGTWPATLGPNETAKFSVEYTAQWSGYQAADSVIVDYALMGQPAAASPLVIPVEAVSSLNACSQLIPSPTSLNFGTVATGQSASAMLMITNGNTVTCTLSSAAITTNDSYGEFSLAAGSPTSFVAIPAGGSTTLTAVFSPTDGSTPDQRSGVLTLTSTGVAPIHVPLVGQVENVVPVQGCINQTLQWTAVNAPQLMNIDWGEYNILEEDMTGPAAVGATAADLWNPAGVPFSQDYVGGPYSWADGSASNVTAEAIGLPGDWGYTTVNCDLMLQNYNYSWSGSNAQIELRGLPAGVYDLYFYADNGQGGDGNARAGPNNSGFGINVFETEDGGLLYTRAPLYTSGTGADPVQWTEGDQYVVLRNLCVNDENRAEVVLYNGVQGTGNNGIIINGTQIVQTASGACVPDGG